MPLFETSAKDDSKADHVDAIFMTLAHKVKQSKPLLAPVPSPPDGVVRPSGKRILYKNENYASTGGGCCL